MVTKKIPLRKCTGCGEMKYKKELIRVIKTPEEEIVIDVTGRKNGRGAYICSSRDCLEKAIKGKKLEKEFETKISDEIYEELRNIMGNN